MKNSATPVVTAVMLLLVFGLLTGTGFAAGDPHGVKVAVAYADNAHNTVKPLPSPLAREPGSYIYRQFWSLGCRRYQAR